MSEYGFKKYVKKQTEEAAFKHLIELKNKPGKHTKMVDLNYIIQEYLLDGNRNTEISKLIFKARGRNLKTLENTQDGNMKTLCVLAVRRIDNQTINCFLALGLVSQMK